MMSDSGSLLHVIIGDRLVHDYAVTSKETEFDSQISAYSGSTHHLGLPICIGKGIKRKRERME